MPQLTWLITGASSGGFGEEFVKQILDRGDRVIATARTLSKITQYEELGAKTLQLDVTASQSDLDKKAQEALAFYGGIDVLVSNAGYAVMGTVEETR